jgi:hypothetical protein
VQLATGVGPVLLTLQVVVVQPLPAFGPDGRHALTGLLASVVPQLMRR